MKTIGFKNFRRFEDFPPIEFNGITFLVGRNNSGKSTLVKSLLLIQDFFKSGNIARLSFGHKVLEDANIVTYGRAKNKKAKKEDPIEFYYRLENYDITIRILGYDDDTYANVYLIKIVDMENNFEFLFEPQIHTVTISKILVDSTNEEGKKTSDLWVLETEINKLKDLVEQSTLKKSSKEYIELVDNLNALEKKRNQYVHGIQPEDETSMVGEELIEYKTENNEEDLVLSYKVSTSYPVGSSLQEIIDFMISETIFLHGEDYIKTQKGEEPSHDFKNYQGIKQDQPQIVTSFKVFNELLFNSHFVYLGANPAKQSALFAIRDRNNSLAQSIHEFFQLKIKTATYTYWFVEKWMKEFEVGDSFEIKIHAGEAYEVNIFSHNTSIPLADKGMGSIQAMLLILRLATVIHRNGITKGSNLQSKPGSRNYTIIIEEPELNLHPRLQSKITDLFLEMNQDYGLSFIIETHSEYVIRRSQIFVKNNEYEVGPNDNPFYVYYFPKDTGPYRMRYEENGRFDVNFGEGFFDEATKSTMALLKPKTNS